METLRSAMIIMHIYLMYVAHVSAPIYLLYGEIFWLIFTEIEERWDD